MSACWKRGTRLSPACLGWLVLLLLPQLHLSTGCPPQQSAPANLNDMLAEAMLHHRQDDRIVLKGLPPSDSVTDSVVSRPRLGEDAAFNCSVPADADWLDVSWRHQDWTVFEAGEPFPLPEEDTTGQTYAFRRVNRTLFLVVRNVTLRSSGSVLCVLYPFSGRQRILQRFQLLPDITRRTDVFAGPDAPYLTVTEGEAVTLQCSIRLPVPEKILWYLLDHLMWVHHGRIVQGPAEAPYGLPQPTGEGPRAVEPYYIIPANNSPGILLHSRLLLRAVALTDAGCVQCLFRPHQHIHEWIVSTTTLRVSPKNTTHHPAGAGVTCPR
ncbi:uncharacterized protein LOC129581918 [Paramacrobiotus metropolitanus]|uniref:uncharacterized protein LOC129581918 n=1 Tax=Paramacrobiotus metropolitanus TaxID=2943436 RepID=UPI002445DAB2|nr:uncharacterized protein LOC129581918 [Paramacrobiotus metropolitanus]